MKQLKIKLHAMYLSWVNDFMTIDRFAEYYKVNQAKAIQAVRIGKIIHEQNVQAYKLTGIEPYKP